MRKHILWTLLLSLVLCACAGTPTEPSWQEHYNLGLRYLEDGNYEEAIIAFTAAIEIDPKQSLPYIGRGDAYMLSGETKENIALAMADYEKALSLDKGLDDETYDDLNKKLEQIYHTLGRDIVRTGAVPMISQGGNAAVREDGNLWMWDGGALGYNNSVADSFRQRYLPDNAPGLVLEDVAAVCINAPRAGGSDVPNFYGAAIKTDGSLWMWGDCVWGWNSTTDEMVQIMDGVAAFSMSYSRGAVVKTDGTLWIVTIEFDGVSDPVLVMDSVASASISDDTLAAIKPDGTLWTMSISYDLGIGAPEMVMDNVAAVSASSGVIAAIKADGSLWMWGKNDYGQLGNSRQGDQTATAYYVDLDDYDPETWSYAEHALEYPIQTTPIRIMDQVVSVSTSDYATAAIREDGSLWTWGQCDLNTSTNATVETVVHSDMSYLRQSQVQTVPLKVMDNVAAVSLGHSALVLKQDGTLWQNQWGSGLHQVLDHVALPYGAPGF